jgi:hypothetical protein
MLFITWCCNLERITQNTFQKQKIRGEKNVP